ncbi:c-type cytochrome [Thiopseudomonas denitrificans]|uniref:Cytochrome c553 n=1 Tax=Thiopseudomonas denitrificans TaxID=1501432 RepID=A0A4R6U0E2_9GAMM|nr:c-type cytochrome [Thiopseudomonas denitrificans]TDQ39401.1 cytochrome c553 [Thiopseudomonas denitrificans]
MKKIRNSGRLALALGLAISTAHAAQGDAKAGAEAAGLCLACHQADGSGMNIPGGESWPRLAGLDEQYLYKQLLDVKSGTRESATMLPFVNMLSDQQLRDVSAYYSQMPATPAKGGEDASEARLAHGQKLAEQGDWDRYIVPCQSCHGPDNQGVGASFPGIAGQHANYIEDQLRNWQKGTRDNDPQHLMAAIAERLNDEDIQAVSAWLSRQPAQ